MGGKSILESDDFHAHITMLRRQLKERRDVLIRKLEEILGDQVEFFLFQRVEYIYGAKCKERLMSIIY